MADIPESLLRRSAEAKAKALGVPVEQILAEMRGEAPPSPTPSAAAPPPATPRPTARRSRADSRSVSAAPAAATAVAERPEGNGGGAEADRRVAASVSPRPVAPPTNAPTGVRTQRLLTVVKARAIQQVKTEPHDKVNTWPHLVLIELAALLGMLAFLVILSVIIQSPLLEPANFNATPNPSKAPWYFLGLQELLSYFDPKSPGSWFPAWGDRRFHGDPTSTDPSTKPSDRKYSMMTFTFFGAVLVIIGVLFRGHGFNFSYPWKDGIFFDAQRSGNFE